MLKKVLSGFALTLASLGSTFAFQPLITDDTGTQGSGGNQLELAGTRAKLGTDTAGEAAFAYTRGLSDTLDVFVEIGRQSIDAGGSTIKGPSNPSFGAKWRFFENEHKTSLALKPVYIAPLSAEQETDGLGTGKASYEVSLILTQEMGWGAVHANLLTGTENYKAPVGDTKVSGFSVAPVWNLSEQIKLALDLGTARSDNNGAVAKSRFGELGFIYSPNADLDLALGFVRDTDVDTDLVTKIATAGVTWRFK